MSKLCIINTIKTKIRGNATSYIERENEIFIPKSDNFTLEQTYKIAVKKVDKINQEYLSEKFGKVVSLNTSAPNGTGIKIHPSQLLIDAYEVKEGNKSIEELNPRNLDYFNGDEALLEQEQKEDSDLKPFIEESKNIGEQIKAIDQQVQEEKTIKSGVSELFESNPELSKIGTVEQYSQYLDTIFPDSKVKEIDDFLYVSVLNQLEKENKIEKDCKGKLKAKDGLRTKFTKNSQWEIVKDLKGYPSHSQGGVDIKLGKDGFSFKGKGGDIKAAHGLVLPNNFENPIEFEAMSKVLSQRNKHLNWVDRGLNPDKYPKIDNQDGTFSTHRLAYSTGDNGEAYVYPTIIQNDKGELEQLDDNAAWEYAKKTKTAMRIPSVKLAEYYSQNGLIKH